jgi:peptidoglycan hydrolase-like protein with peptidoglycan-binding domain
MQKKRKKHHQKKTLPKFDSIKYPCDKKSPTLKWDGKTPPKYSPYTIRVQTFLKDQGFLKQADIDGYYGKTTRDAVKAWQEDSLTFLGGSIADGIFGPKSWNLMCNIVDTWKKAP